jgi:hypothetical protein
VTVTWSGRSLLHGISYFVEVNWSENSVEVTEFLFIFSLML